MYFGELPVRLDCCYGEYPCSVHRSLSLAGLLDLGRLLLTLLFLRKAETIILPKPHSPTHSSRHNTKYEMRTRNTKNVRIH